jgi:GTP cyclohydrolase I
MSTRGVLKQEALTSTSAVRGIFLTNEAGCKDEFFAIIGKE